MSENIKNTAGQYLTFTLADEIFALDITTVKEVLELTTITRIPRMPDYMRGVINLRGQGVPVIDLRRKFGLECAKDSVNTCIIIVEVHGPEGWFNMGALADSVREVLEIGADEIMPAPKMGSAVKMDCIEGISQQGDSFTIILKVERIFSDEELEQVQVATPDAAEKNVIEPAIRARQAQPEP